jgi:DNA-binding NarL/FixJ family response regulator
VSELISAVKPARTGSIGKPDISLFRKLGGSADYFVEQTIYGAADIPQLTPREKEILRLIVSGKTNKEIARSLCRVERTVEYHRNHLMRKLSVRNTAELFKKVISIGIIPI